MIYLFLVQFPLIPKSNGVFSLLANMPIHINMFENRYVLRLIVKLILVSSHAFLRAFRKETIGLMMNIADFKSIVLYIIFFTTVEVLLK